MLGFFIFFSNRSQSLTILQILMILSERLCPLLLRKGNLIQTAILVICMIILTRSSKKVFNLSLYTGSWLTTRRFVVHFLRILSKKSTISQN